VQKYNFSANTATTYKKKCIFAWNSCSFLSLYDVKWAKIRLSESRVSMLTMPSVSIFDDSQNDSKTVRQ
jgi:hypothetical protein